MVTLNNDDELDPSKNHFDSNQEFYEMAQYFCKQAVEDENLLSYFFAFMETLQIAHANAVDKALAENGENHESYLIARAADKYLRLPADLFEYLNVITSRICQLARGQDFRDSSSNEIKNASQDCTNVDNNQRIRPDQAASLVTQALGLTQPGGFNAFSVRTRIKTTQAFVDEHSFLAEKHGSRARASAVLMDMYGFADERSLRRKLSGKKRTGGGKAPP